GRLADFQSILAGCSWTNENYAGRENLLEPWWFFLGVLLSYCENGPEIFHKLSSADPRYSPVETNEKLSRNLKPVTCDYIANDLGYEGCKECPLYKSKEMKSPI